MQGQSIFITGGAGYLGRATLRKAIREGWGSRFTIFSRDETKQDELMKRYGRDVDVRCILGDVCQPDGLAAAMRGHDLVINAAAVKYIPEAEQNVDFCVRVNVIGSMNVARAAIDAGVRVVVGISTDKATEPVNTYGHTKALMERLYGEYARAGGPIFVTVRYGNVAGSTGSVIPLFARQLAEHKRITLTSRQMSRFWLGPDDAVEMIERAVEDAPSWPGATFIHYCPAMMIEDLAQAVIVASDGNETVEEVEISEIGIRPGEKLAEALLGQAETPRAFEWQTDGLVLLPPDPPRIQATNLIKGGHHPAPYTSDKPDEWVSVSQMAAWIEDARTI